MHYSTTFKLLLVRLILNTARLLNLINKTALWGAMGPERYLNLKRRGLWRCDITPKHRNMNQNKLLCSLTSCEHDSIKTIETK